MLLKELQSLGLDVKVLREENGEQKEVEIMETVDYGETDINHIMDDKRYKDDQESFGDHGYTEQEFEGGELVDVAEEEEDDTVFVLEESFDGEIEE